MRAILLLVLFALPLSTGCDKGGKSTKDPMAPVAAKIGGQPAQDAGDLKENVKGKDEAFVAFQDEGAPPGGKGGIAPEKKDKAQKPRKIRYTADMKLIVDKIDDAEEALDAIRIEAKGEYEKAEVNRSANTVRTGMWRIRVPNDNLGSFRKAVAKLGDVERDTIESEDMTAKYYDLDAHITNRKVDREEIRKFLVEIGKKDPRYLEVKRELDTVSDDINRKEGMLKLWANQTELTTFTIQMREKQPYNPPPPPNLETTPTFGERADKTWNNTWDLFVGFCQGVAIVGIAVTPWLPFPIVIFLGLWIAVRLSRRSSKKPPPEVVVVEQAPQKKVKKEEEPEAQ